MSKATEVDGIVKDVTVRVAVFAAEAHAVLSRFESARASRVMAVEDSRQQLKGLSLQQEQLFDEALNCVSHGLYRAAIVAAWQGYMDLLDAKLGSDGFVKLRAARPRWPQSGTIEDIRDETPEHQRIELARQLGLIDKASMKSLQGMLSTRNTCAHTSAYTPSLNASLGYVTDLIDRAATLLTKSL